jgi:hypothetical protein
MKEGRLPAGDALFVFIFCSDRATWRSKPAFTANPLLAVKLLFLSPFEVCLLLRREWGFTCVFGRQKYEITG